MERRHRTLNNPFPRQPKALGFVHGRLVFDAASLRSQVWAAGVGFMVHWNPELGGTLWVEHQSEPGRSLWSTAAGTAFVTAALGNELVEESRGSFAIHDEIEMICRHQTIEEILVVWPERKDESSIFNCQSNGCCASVAGTVDTRESASGNKVTGNTPTPDADGTEIMVNGPAVVVTGCLYSDEADAVEQVNGLLQLRNGPLHFLQRLFRNGHHVAVRYWLTFAEKRDHHLGFSVRLDQPVSLALARQVPDPRKHCGDRERVSRSSVFLAVTEDFDRLDPCEDGKLNDEYSMEILEQHQWLWSERSLSAFASSRPLLVFRHRRLKRSFTISDFRAGLVKEEDLVRKHRLTPANRITNAIPFETQQQLPRFNRVQLTYLSDRNERFFGFGEQFSFFDLKGRRVPILVQEQGLGRGDQPITAAANLISYRSGGSWHTTYAPSPYYMTSAMRSLFLENYEYSVFDLRRHDRVQVQVSAGSMQGRILHGRTPSELIKRYTDAIGRMRELPDWILKGAIIGMQGGTHAVRQVLAQLKKFDVPMAAFWLQDWVSQRKTSIGWQLWWNWEVDTDHYHGWEDLVKELRSEGIRTMTYCNPLLASVDDKQNRKRNLLDEAKFKNYVVNNSDGEPYMIKNTSFDAAVVDLTNPAARTWMKGIMRDMIRTGIRGWMADFGEALPFDSVLFSGENAAVVHNKFPELWAELNREIVEEWEAEHKALRDSHEVNIQNDENEQLVFFMRAGYRGSPKWSTLFWEGDQMVSWQRNDGIKSAVVGLLSSGISGYSLNHSDIGGYTTVDVPLLKYVRSEELLIRWMELNAFSVIFRTHEGNVPGANSQFYTNATTLSYFARCAKLYKAWEFYRRQLVKEAAASGLPIVRHLFLHYPRDEVVQRITYEQFLVGSEIMVVPVLDKGRRNVQAYFPGEDEWEHVWTKKLYSSKEQTRHSRAWIEAPIGFPAVFVKKGSNVGSTFISNLNSL